METTQIIGPDDVHIEDAAALCARVAGIDLARVREIQRFAVERRQSLVAMLVEREEVNEAALLRGLAAALQQPFIDAPPAEMTPELLAAIPPSLAIKHHVFPLALTGDRLELAAADPFDWHTFDELQQLLERPLLRVLCPAPVIDKMLKAHYGIGADTVERLVAGRSAASHLQVTGPAATNLSEEEAANEPTVVNLVNRILTEAIRAGATDIHFEPYESKYRVRYRVDGMLEDVAIPASVKLLRLALVSRIKIMANLDITEKRLPQDGRAQVTLAGQPYDLRISILPGVYGEAVNIRLQTRGMVKLDLASLGFEEHEQNLISRLIRHPHGLVLVTGPTGSGKTTTLYTCLTMINQPDTKIITVEDPVEYWMEDILQMQVHDEIGFTFARALRSILRHDPDVVLVGEIRDRETADIAIRASLTGHLVFATLHTNDAPSAVTRLLDLGIEPFLAASSIVGVLAQRLVRKVCAQCRQVLPAEAAIGPEPLCEGKGCERCRFTGYRGRSAIGEIMNMTPALRELIQQRQNADRLKAQAITEGMLTLRDAARRRVQQGVTTLAEMVAVTSDDR